MLSGLQALDRGLGLTASYRPGPRFFKKAQRGKGTEAQSRKETEKPFTTKAQAGLH